MSKIRTLALSVVLAAVSIGTPLSAQMRSTANRVALDAAVASRPASNRVVVTAAFSTSEAIGAAAQLGVNASQLSSRVAALDDVSVSQYADMIRAGGRANVVISTTAIIIGLLVLILLVG